MGRAHCWTGYRDTLEFGSQAWIDSWAEPDKTCLQQITVEFK